uniref:Nardilysin convertase n=1 Tax=Sinocyclocheilus grahami TaxID=75366 RepID=A0A672Q6A6_SINGR
IRRNILNTQAYRLYFSLYCEFPTAALCAFDAKVVSLLKMPQTNKFKSAGASSAAQSAGPDRGEALRDPNAPPGDSGGDDNQGDPQIIKSPSDPKQYRYIELSNGLRALLISDLSDLDGKTEDDEDSEEEEEEEEEEGEEAEEEGDSGEGTDEESEEEGDSQDSDFEELDEDNDRKKKKGSEKQSAAALCIGVGSFSDPNDLPGLAHFLEHMVFMGSEKYPSENGFDAFLKKHGGSDNASTDCERTIFQFDVQRKCFKEALDRWAQFFVCPLMIEDAIDREVEAVDSEYQLAKPSDSHRKEMLFGSLAKPNHPMSKFCWGNALTLKTEPREKNINVYKRLREFWKRYYSAHYMTLAVQSKESLDTLEEWVREIFSQVPNNGKPKPDFSDQLSPFETPAFNKLYRMVPVRKVHALTITWALPPQEKHYRVKPLHYIAWLIGHEGTGSILSMLRRKCWALALFGGNSETGFDQNTTYSIFSISITLTDEGFQNFYEVAHLVISVALHLLTPKKANLLLLSPEHEGQCPLREKWFGTQYSVEDIQQHWRELWAGDFDLNPSLHLPAENKFIATDFTLKTSDCPDTEYPVKIMNNDRGCLWYKKDNKFKIPKAYVQFHLISPVVQKSAKNLVLFDLFVNILVHNLADPSYEADVAQLEYKFVAGEHGLVIKVKGFNHKLPLLFNLIVDYLADFSAAPDVFSMFAEQLKKTYFNILIKPEKLGKDVRLQILEHSRWSTIQKYQAVLDGLSVDELMEFVSSFKSELYAEGLVQGNFTSTVSFLTFYIHIKLSVEVPVLFRVVELPQKHHLCKVKSLNKGDANSEVTVYYQSGPKNLREHTLMELLVMHMEEPCFDFLRTKETLGYHVYPTCRNTSGVLGFSVTVETQATKFNTELVETKIEEFLVSFGEKMNSLSHEAFKTQVTALVKLKGCEDTHLGEEVNRNWTEVVTQQYVFDRLSREVRSPVAHEQRLTVQQCVNDELFEEGSKMSLYGEVSKLTFLPVSTLLASVTTITDIQAFTSTLNLYPYHKILK